MTRIDGIRPLDVCYVPSYSLCLLAVLARPSPNVCTVHRRLLFLRMGSDFGKLKWDDCDDLYEWDRYGWGKSLLVPTE